MIMLLIKLVIKLISVIYKLSCILFNSLYSSTVERNTVNILIYVQFMLEAYRYICKFFTTACM